jgi:hypothetical protein
MHDFYTNEFRPETKLKCKQSILYQTERQNSTMID